MGEPKRIGIIVVAYNAASTLAKVLDRIPHEFIPRITQILICDDASDDETYLVGLGYKQVDGRRLPLEVLRNPLNLGYGGNQKMGYGWAIEHDLDIVVLLHADGQYAPELLPEIVAPLERGEADAVFGSRMMTPGGARKGGMPIYKLIGNKVLSTIENRLAGADLSEWHSGYRAYSVAALRDVPFRANADGYHFDTQIIIQFHEAGKRIVEIPIPTYYGDEISYVNGPRYAIDIVKDVIKYRGPQDGPRQRRHRVRHRPLRAEGRFGHGDRAHARVALGCAAGPGARARRGGRADRAPSCAARATTSSCSSTRARGRAGRRRHVVARSRRRHPGGGRHRLRPRRRHRRARPGPRHRPPARGDPAGDAAGRPARRQRPELHPLVPAGACC